MKNGRLIVIEGACDGIGKSSQLKLLREHLITDGYDIVSHHFPTYNTYQGVPVERYLQGELGSPKSLSPYFVNALYAMDRAITWQQELKKYYQDGKTILLDRYTTSSLIYQSALIENIDDKKEFIDYVIDFEYKKIGLKEPDLVIFLNAPFDVVANIRNLRKNNDGITNDIHERDLLFMKKVYESAIFVSKYLAWNEVICNYDDAMRSKTDIHDDIYSLVKKKI